MQEASRVFQQPGMVLLFATNCLRSSTSLETRRKGRVRREALRPGTGGDGENVAEKLKQLGELHAAGVLTQEEFEAKKAELLDRL